MAAVSQDIGWEAALHHPGPWTEEDFDRLPEGLRAELHYGRLILTPSASNSHNNAARRLAMILEESVEETDQVGTDVDVRLADGEIYYRPDAFVLRTPAKGRPLPGEDLLLVVEVISPGGGKEFRQKMADYAEAGVPAYLILKEETAGFAATLYLLRDDAYVLAEKVAPGGVLDLREPIECSIDLARLEGRRRTS
ncbi:restriction endonuclease [Actinorhabdospora filicis]|uniref:Restriction endonuclease n=1 Tax=Actinorhabdospora filicis TaxID=1785913 RepID=A0A9W6W7V2_9ACTN|nr:Uma2 family endonuclease [Actinorhabdospora filicis]GLZ76939.1 restriction endonuclease [Actinorhabdospora filicis]